MFSGDVARRMATSTGFGVSRLMHQVGLLFDPSAATKANLEACEQLARSAIIKVSGMTIDKFALKGAFRSFDEGAFDV